jgi:sugar phosphate permease
MFRMGLPALGPALRDQFSLSLAQVGLVFTTVSVGVALGLVPWGIVTDKIGERPVLGFGMVAFAGTLVLAAFAPNFELFLAAMLLAGIMGASATGASGRAVMAWFAITERGTALGIRQMAIPIGGAIGSLLLPLLAHAEGMKFAFLFLAGMALTAAITSAVWMRDPAVSGKAEADLAKPMTDGRQWRLGFASALLVVGQSAALGFFVLFLHDERGLSIGLAAGCLAAIQLLGASGRIISGRLSDTEGVRIPLLRHIALAMAVLFAATAALTNAPGVVLYPVLIAAGVIALSWNALAFTAAAEIAGLTKAATAMGLQNTIVSIGSIAAPVAFGLLVEATSYPVGFAAVAIAPIASFALLRTLQDDEAERARERRGVPQPSVNPTEVTA